MKVLIGVPPSNFPPAGPAYVAAMLRQAGHLVTGHVFSSARRFRQEVGKGFDVVATGGLCSQFEPMKCMVDIAHAQGVQTIVGGGIVSSEPELMTRELGTDYSVLGQGEITAVDLVDALGNDRDTTRVVGIGFVRDGRFHATPARPEIERLDELPFPDYDVFGFRDYLDAMRPSDRDMLNLVDRPREYPLIASRSCPHKCSFCYHPSGYTYRCRSVDSILAELQEVVPKYRINIISIFDELFNVDEKRLFDFCERFKAFQATVPWEMNWFCCLRVSDLKADTLRVMRESGCYMVSYGFESYSAAVLKSMRKLITPDQIHRAVHETLDHGLVLQANFIFGDRAETLESAEETLAFWREHQEAGIFTGPILVCPNSPDYQYCLQKGLIEDRLVHIRDRLFEPVNMTAMPDRDFYRLLTLLYIYNITQTICVSPLTRTRDALTVRCPHCHQTIEYRSYATPWLFYKHRLVCRACRKRFFVIGWWYQLFLRVLVAMAPRSAISYQVYVLCRRARSWLQHLGRRAGWLDHRAP